MNHPQQQPKNAANLYQTIENTHKGAPPLVIEAINTPFIGETYGGIVETPRRKEYYVLLSALPQELQQKVTLAVQALQADR
jgi:hypothetical protein